ncbi:MAG: DUF4834 domain-containing protein [Bacteroidetes bacterium MED-G21]|nr:MAG: DUF4834 domain-containing protein [Bacteroidetes bacterium MED-G21]
MLVGFIKTLLIILFFYYGFKVLARLLAPFLMRYAAKKIQDRFKDQMGQQMRGSGFGQQNNSKKEGEVHVKSKKSSQEKINSDSVGDYVDFEEIE